MTKFKSYERTTTVECIDNNKLVEADVITYVEGKYLTVSLNTVRVNLQYNQKYNNLKDLFYQKFTLLLKD